MGGTALQGRYSVHHETCNHKFPRKIPFDSPAYARWCFLRSPCPRARLRTTVLFPPSSERRWLLRFADWSEAELHQPQRDATTPVATQSSDTKHRLRVRAYSIGPSIALETVSREYRHYSGSRHYPTYYQYWSVPSTPSDFTRIITDNRHHFNQHHRGTQRQR